MNDLERPPRDADAGLILIGYWDDESPSGWPDVHRFVQPHWEHRMEVAMWLAGGFRIAMMGIHQMGLSSCRFCGEDNGSAERTDGTYVWPEGLAHYVWKHDVQLPDEIVTHIQRTSAELEELSVSADWWRQQDGGI